MGNSLDNGAFGPLEAPPRSGMTEPFGNPPRRLLPVFPCGSSIFCSARRTTGCAVSDHHGWSWSAPQLKRRSSRRSTSRKRRRRQRRRRLKGREGRSADEARKSTLTGRQVPGYGRDGARLDVMTKLVAWCPPVARRPPCVCVECVVCVSSCVCV